MEEVQKIVTGSQLITQVGLKLDRFFSLDDEVRRKNYELAFYNFCENEKLLSYSMDPKKGLLVVGDIGVGKSMMMKVMQVVFKDTVRRFKWVDSIQLKDLYDDGMKLSELKELYGFGYKGDLLFDDIGLGQTEIKNYGNTVNIVGELLWDRSLLFVESGYRTHLTSNIPTRVEVSPGSPQIKTLETLYGDRILDRIVQMNNLMVWKGKSLRRK